MLARINEMYHDDYAALVSCYVSALYELCNVSPDYNRPEISMYQSNPIMRTQTTRQYHRSNFTIHFMSDLLRQGLW